MSEEFKAMQRVRDAYEAVLRNPGDASAQAAFADLHQAHQDTYVEKFEVGGVSYPRTDGHKMSEREARAVISRLLADPRVSLPDLRPSVIAAAYPLEGEVLRSEIRTTVELARTINSLDWRSDTLDDASKKAIRELLRMPTEAGSYQEICAIKAKASSQSLSIFRGYDADHLIPDKVLRGTLLRGQSGSLLHSFATFMQDSQNKGSQHHYVTQQQRLARKKLHDGSNQSKNPTTGEYLEEVLKWMTHVYTTGGLGVDVAVKDNALGNRNDFQRFNVKGFALAQGGYMTYAERKEVGRAVAVALLIEAREFYTAAGWPMDRELPLFHDIPPTVTQQPLPVTGGPA